MSAALASCGITVGEKKAPSGPLGHRCQGHLSAAMFLCVLPHSSQHAAWLHKMLSAWGCPTAGRLRLQQSCCAAPIPVPLPPLSQTHSTSWLLICLSCPLCLSYWYLRRHMRGVLWGWAACLFPSPSKLLRSVDVYVSVCRSDKEVRFN